MVTIWRVFCGVHGKSRKQSAYVTTNSDLAKTGNLDCTALSSFSSSSVSSTSSVASIDVSFAAELAAWVGKSEQNINIMQEFVDFYSKSSSHASVVAKVNDYLFEYRGLASKVEIYADIAKTTPLTSAQRDEIYQDRERMNQLVGLFNVVFGPQTAQ